MKKKDFFATATPSLISKYKRFEQKQREKKSKRNRMIDKYFLEKCLDGFID